MNNGQKLKLSHTIASTLLLLFIANFPLNAATFEMKEGSEDKAFSLDIDFSGLESTESIQKQAIEQVKNNYLRVLELIKKKQYEQANEKVTDLIQQKPNQSVYYNLKAMLQWVNKDPAGAEHSYLKAVELNPRNAQALTGLANLALTNKQFKQATHYANNVLAINPYRVRAYQILARVAMQQQGIDAAEKVLLDAHTKVKDNFKAELVILQTLEKIYQRKKQTEKLLPLVTDLIERNKNETSALILLANAQLVNKDENGAEKTLRQIIAQQPKDAKHRLLLVKILAKQKNNETEILDLLDKAVPNMENPAQALSQKVAIHINQKHYPQAFAIAQQVDVSNPRKIIGKVLKGHVYLAQKQYKKALHNYQLAYQMTPNMNILDAMIKTLTLQKKPKVAVVLLEKELAKYKENTVIQTRLAFAYQNTEQYDLSIKYYEQVLTKQKDNVNVLNNLAWIYNQQNNPKAIKLSEQAYKLAPKSGVIADTYGYILFNNGKIPESIEVLQQALELDPNLTEIQHHLAEAYIALQDTLKARKILQQILSNNPGDEKALQLWKTL